MTETQVQTRRGRIIAVLVGVAVTLGLSAGMEFFALKQNQRLGKQLPFLYSPVTKKHLNTLLGEAEFTLLDPLLGYAHSDDEGQQNIYMPHSYLPGFIAYGTETPDSFERPIIVTLGGSTTDPVFPWGISWPEQLARYLAQNKLPGTVINGGVGGYSSSQELFKLIRDVIELKPDILITYNGANDVGNRWAELPHPMIHTYQRRIFDHVYVDQEPVSQILPNTILYLRAIMRANPSPTPLSGITYGIKTSHSCSVLDVDQGSDRGTTLPNALARL